MNNNLGQIINPSISKNGERIGIVNFGIIPNSIWIDKRISPLTKCICAYFCGRPNNWIPTVEDIKKTFELDDRKWFKCRDEMRKINVIPPDHPLKICEENGKKYYWILQIDLTQFFQLSTLQIKLSTAILQNCRMEKEKNLAEFTKTTDGIHPAKLRKNHPAKTQDNELLNLKKLNLEKRETCAVREMKSKLKLQSSTKVIH